MSDFDEVHAMSLSDFFERELGMKAKRTGKTVRFSFCPWCGEGPKESVRLAILPGDLRCKCHRCGEGGDIIDAATVLWGVDTNTAIRKLLGKSTDSPKIQIKQRVIRPQEEIDQEEMAQTAALREAIRKIQSAAESHKDNPACLDYLLIERSLPISLVREAQRRKMLCFMPHDPKDCKDFLMEHVGEELLKASGLWKEGSKAPAIIWRPLVFILPGCHSAEFRNLGESSEDSPKSIRYGTAKLPFVWRAAQPSDRAMIVEGFIDMLSSVALGFGGHVVGLPGCNNWQLEWFQVIANSLGVTRWIEALDNDDEEVDDEDALEKGLKLKNPGQFWANRLHKALSELNMQQVRHAPPVNMDINDVLRDRMKKAA